MKSVSLGFASNFVMVPKALVQPLHLVLSALYYKGVEQGSIQYRKQGSIHLPVSVYFTCVWGFLMHVSLCIMYMFVPIETRKVR